MPLPKQVQRQAAEADRLVAQMNGQTPPDDIPPASPQDTPPATPPVQAQPPAPAPQPAPVQHVQQQQPPQPDGWEARYHTLQGKYNAEVPGLQAQLQNALNAVANMGRELDTVKAQLTSAQARPAQSTPAVHLTPADETTWGADMLDMVRRGAQEEAHKLVQPLLDENAQLKAQLAQVQGQTQQVAQTQQQTAQSQFWTRLLEQVPDWQVLNTDQGFLQWLGQYDPMLGDSRQNALTAAVNTLNADRAAAFFKGYKALLPPPPVVDPQVELQRQITPRATRAQAPAPAGGGGQQTVEIWSQEEIMQFYTDLNRGRYRHDPAEAQRMRTAIDQAVAEGRVR